MVVMVWALHCNHFYQRRAFGRNKKDLEDLTSPLCCVLHPLTYLSQKKSISLDTIDISSPHKKTLQYSFYTIMVFTKWFTRFVHFALYEICQKGDGGKRSWSGWHFSVVCLINFEWKSCNWSEQLLLQPHLCFISTIDEEAVLSSQLTLETILH